MTTIKNWQEYSYYLALHLKNKERPAFRKQFLSLHPNDQLAFIYMLNEHTRKRLYRYIAPAEFAEIFGRLEPSEQRMVVEELQPAYAQETVRAMPTDEMVDFLSGFSVAETVPYLNLLEVHEADKVKRMLGYGKHTAGALMTTEYMVAHITHTVADVLLHVREQGENAETIYYIYIVDDEEILRGVVSLRDILLEAPTTVVEAIMQDKLISVETHIDQETVLHIVRDYDLLALPVTEQGKLLGIVTVDDVMDVYYEETEEDFGELAGVSGAIDLDIGVMQATKIRLGWLLRLIVISMLPVIFIYLNPQHAYSIALAVPFIASIAGNAGIQSLTAATRVKEQGNAGDFKKLLLRDSLVASLIATVVACIIAMLAYMGEQSVIALMSCAWLAIVLSSLVGTTLPYVVKQSASASSPVIATWSDAMTVILFITLLSF
ncbi:MAG TPA: magnesium transporter [Metalysinibacillus sp.]